MILQIFPAKNPHDSGLGRESTRVAAPGLEPPYSKATQGSSKQEGN